MRKLTFLLGVSLMSSALMAQVTDGEKALKEKKIDTIQGWKKGGAFMLNFSQVSLTNWNAGGLNSFSLNGTATLFANYTKGKGQWENTLDLGYGILRQGRKGNVAWLKTDDKIDLFSKFGRGASKSWFYSVLFNFKTQATPGFSYPNDSIAISKFMAPGYTLLAIGMDYKPSKVFSAFIAPITMKNTFVLDDDLANARAFGLDPLGTGKIRSELGGYVRLQLQLENADAERKAFQNISFTSKLDLFSNYLENPSRIDVNWENLLQLKVNQYISATLSTQLIYDDDINIAGTDANNVAFNGPRVQFKEVLGIGFAYTFKAGPKN
ncbi:MAG: hypothetical protein ACI857_002030 [Arenicella sp.]|jgi:hypothetical protein